MTPATFTGTWRRSSVSIGGAAPSEPAKVVWIQVGDVFADLRIPHDPAGEAASFAGTTSWQEPHLRWCHEIDLAAGGADDVGAMCWEGDTLVETGAFERDGVPVAYVERWRRQPGSTGESLALRRHDAPGVFVQTGDHALVVCDDRPAGGEHRAGYWTRTAGTWSESLTLATSTPAPPPPAPPPPAPPASSAGPAWLLLDSHRWQVVHAGRHLTPVHTPHPEGART